MFLGEEDRLALENYIENIEKTNLGKYHKEY